MSSRFFFMTLLASMAASIVLGQARCGASRPACPASQCCSRFGWCGITAEHCLRGCQSPFGSCGPRYIKANSTDVPASTAGAAAQVITRCRVPNTIAITFDDGPGPFTAKLLDLLDHLRIRVTFFVNGRNYVDTRAPRWQALLRRAYRAGHQIASHTLTHRDLSKSSVAVIRHEMLENARIIESAIGKRPRYMRPPYGEVSPQALRVLRSLQYRVVNWSADTKDTEHKTLARSVAVYQRLLRSPRANRAIVLEHDTERTSALKLLPRVVPLILARNLKIVTVAQCLGDPKPYF